jgi:hypothetical protein
MLKVSRVRVGADNIRQTWYDNDNFSLIVWQDTEEKYIGFELYYDLNYNEHCLLWRDGRESQHLHVDDGEATPKKNMTPVVSGDGKFPYDRIKNLFLQSADLLDELLINKITEQMAMVLETR